MDRKNPYYRLHDVWANLHPALRISLILIILATTFVIAVGPGKTVYRKLIFSQNLEKAKTALADKRYFEARDLSRRALQTHQTAYEPLALLLRSSTALRDSLAVKAAIGILHHDDANPGDQLLAWRHLCKSSPSFYPLAIWETLPASVKDLEPYQLPLIDRMLYDRMPEAALATIANLPKPLSVEIQTRRLQALAVTDESNNKSNFLRNLIVQLYKHPNEAPRLLQLIDQIPQSNLPPGLYNAIPLNLKQSGSSNIQTSLRILRCELAAKPNQSKSLLHHTLANYKSSDPHALARWYLQIDLPRHAAEILNLDVVADTPPIYRLQLETLRATAQLKKLSEFLTHPPNGFPPWEASALLATVTTGDKSQDLQKKSLAAAAKSYQQDALIQLARLAENHNLTNLATNAWVLAISRASGPLPPAESIPEIITQLYTQKREDELYAVLNAYFFIETSNHIIRTQRLYLACLTGRVEPQSVINEITPLHQQFPDNIALRCILAIAHVLSGHSEKADELTSLPEVDWFSIAPAHRAIRGIALTETNQINEARIYFDNFPWDTLLPSEKRVFENLLDGKLD